MSAEDRPPAQHESDPLRVRRRDLFQEMADRFDLPYKPGDPSNQDWELVVADPGKISRFVAGFEQVDARAQYVLAELLMASFDEAAEAGTFPQEDWERFWCYVKKNFDHLSPIVAYWAMDNEYGSWAVGPYLWESLRRDNIQPPPWPF